MYSDKVFQPSYDHAFSGSMQGLWHDLRRFGVRRCLPIGVMILAGGSVIDETLGLLTRRFLIRSSKNLAIAGNVINCFRLRFDFCGSRKEKGWRE